MAQQLEIISEIVSNEITDGCNFHNIKLMSFDSYKNVAEVLKEYNITSTEENYIVETEVKLRDYFKEELEFSLREFVFEESEYAVCETIIFPVLREVYRNYRDEFTLWSHKAIAYDEKLSGTPDYILAKRSPLGKEIFEQPFFVTVEAKRDDFIKGWGQCLAEMVRLAKGRPQAGDGEGEPGGA